MDLRHVRNHKGVILAICSCFLLASLLSGCKDSFNETSHKSIDVVNPTTSYISTTAETTKEKKDKDLEEIGINNFKPIKEYFINYDFDVNINGTKEEPLSFTVKGKYDLNLDGSLDSISFLLRGPSGKKNFKTYLHVNNIKNDVYMDHTMDGEARIIDLDQNDKFIEITCFDEGPSGDPEYIFYRYNGTELYYIGSLPSDTLIDGKGNFIPGSYLSKLDPKFYSAWYEIKDNRFVEKYNDIREYLGKTYKFGGGEAYFIPSEEMPKDFEPRWEETRQFEASEIKVIDVYFYSGERNLNYYFVELQNGEKGMLYFWIGD